MLEIGKYHILRVIKEHRSGVYLGDREGNEVLLPRKYVPEGISIDGTLKVFIYKDHEERLVATTLEPKITLNHFAVLKVNMVTPLGAFLDWGLEKDLFVPFREQPSGMKEGKSYLVYLYQDTMTGRLVGSARVNRFLSNDPLSVKEGDEVEVLAWEASPLGMKVIVNQKHTGLVYQSELFAPLAPGDLRKGYIAKIRPGNKLDVQLRKPGYASVEQEANRILDRLKTENGFLPLTDHSTPEEITRHLEMSKKTFKKAVGLLYKRQQIKLAPDGIYLI